MFPRAIARMGPALAAALALALAGAVVARESHWAYQSIVRPAVPPSPEAPHPVDAFLRARLDREHLPHAAPADRRTLLRRLFFDLVGLPPSPAELDAFELDPAPDAYERRVDQLLASPRYGERWARHWMDAAHFAETHGHDQDRIRTSAWPYRDYLVRSFNSDKPYARFVTEQVAGDVCFPESPEATVALGFIAAGPWDESSLRDIREDTLDRQIARYVDRDDMVATVMTVFTSTTVQCARCHDHKFDPIPQSDYYALQAVFAGVERAHRTFDADPVVHVQRRDLRTRQRRVERRDPAFLLAADSRTETDRWSEAERSRRIPWSPVRWQTFSTTGGSVLQLQPDGSILATGPKPDKETYLLSARSPLRTVTAVRLEVLPDPSAPKNGPGRAENGNFHLSEFNLQCFDPGAVQARDIPFRRATADHNQTDWTITHAIDGNEKSAWGIHPREGEPHAAVFELKSPLVLAEDATLVFHLRQLHGGSHVIARLRISATDSRETVRLLPKEISDIVALPPTQRSQAQDIQLAAQALGERLAEAIAALPPPSHVYAAADDFEPDGGLKPPPAPREVRVLHRGEITRPGNVASPGSLACTPFAPARFSLPDNAHEGERRAALARWLAHPDNPLTWRSVVNRVWLQHFGRGIVHTPNDLGRMGSAPSHPELLDWLAAWFRDDASGSLKQLHRLLVTSATYRQSVQPPRNAAERDPENRLLSHMNRLRLDAECVRDSLLAASGRLDSRMGGPGDRHFDLQPGIHVTPRIDYTRFDVDSSAAGRRSIYRFLFRTLPDPFFEALDCPAGDQLTGARDNTVTVQQALALWNNAFTTRQAAHLAQRLQRESRNPETLVDHACLLLWGRKPDAHQRSDLLAYTRRHGPENLCRVLINSNEFVFVD